MSSGVSQSERALWSGGTTADTSVCFVRGQQGVGVVF